METKTYRITLSYDIVMEKDANFTDSEIKHLFLTELEEMTNMPLSTAIELLLKVEVIEGEENVSNKSN